MKCPRRAEGGPHFLPEEDTWDEDNTCSYCGSLDPVILFDRLKLGDVEITPTDKSYKIYVVNKGGQKFKMRYRKDCDMGKPGSKCTGPVDCTHWVIDEREQTKFYFQHLSESQQSYFCELYNDSKLMIGPPGHFYVLPFFVKR